MVGERRASRSPWGAVAVALAAIMGATSMGVPGPVRAGDPEGVTPSLVLPADEDLAGDARLYVDDMPPGPAGDADMRLILQDATDRVAELDPSDWRLDSLARALEYDPISAFEFVRDRIGLDATAGVLRGAAGTLAARSGSSADRALLLQALLDTMLVRTRFATARLDDTTTDRVLARALAAPVPILPQADPAKDVPFDLGRVLTRARRDHALLRGALGDRVDALGDADLVGAREATRDHTWVQAFRGTDWVDLDPTFADSQPGDILAPPTRITATIPTTERQALRVRVEADVLASGSITTITALDAQLDAAAAAESEIWLYFQPEQAGLGGSIVEALTGSDAFVPWLLVDGQPRPGSAIPVHAGGDILSGGADDSTQLLTLRLIVDRTGPGLEPTAATRVLLDRGRPVDPADPSAVAALTPLAEDDSGPQVFRVVHHLLVSTGSASPYIFAMRRAMASDFVWRLLSTGGDIDGYDLGDVLFPKAVVDEGLTMAEDLVSLPAAAAAGDVRAWVSRPRVTIVSTDFGAVSEGASLVSDLLFDDISVAPVGAAPAAAAARAKVWYGTIQSAFETAWVLEQAAGEDTTAASVSTAMREPSSLLIADGAGPTRDLPAGIIEALDQGLMVVVPGSAASAIGWWTIDPIDGATRSVGRGGQGWGTVGPRGGSGPPPKQTNPYNQTKTWDVSGEKPARRAGPPQGKCRGGSEYSTLIGCLSLPMAIVYYGTIGIGVLLIINYVNNQWRKFIGMD